MSEIGLSNSLVVDPTEGGQKLLQFLLRRLALPQPLMHRWIRTGQIRINGGRAKPFDHVQSGDTVRVPPFALGMAASAAAPVQHASALLSPLPPSVYEDQHLLVLHKPAGLPVHTGTGHSDSIATRLEQLYAHAPFRPTPAHRLDKDTSGLLLVARSYAALRALQEALKERTLVKEYVAWVAGSWPHEQPRLLRHQMDKCYTGNDEKVHVVPEEQGKDAACVVHCLRRQPQGSLMHIRLLTGRTHQIRVQLAAEGHPLLGDVKYGGPAGTLCLHALRLILPQQNSPANANTHASLPADLQGRSFTLLPPWEGWQAMSQMPPPCPDPLPSPGPASWPEAGGHNAPCPHGHQ